MFGRKVDILHQSTVFFTVVFCLNLQILFRNIQQSNNTRKLQLPRMEFPKHKTNCFYVGKKPTQWIMFTYQTSLEEYDKICISKQPQTIFVANTLWENTPIYAKSRPRLGIKPVAMIIRENLGEDSKEHDVQCQHQDRDKRNNQKLFCNTTANINHKKRKQLKLI